MAELTAWEIMNHYWGIDNVACVGVWVLHRNGT